MNQIRLKITLFLFLLSFGLVEGNAAEYDKTSDIDSIIAVKQNDLLKKYRTNKEVAGILWPESLGELLNFGDDALEVKMYEIAGEAYRRAGKKVEKANDKPVLSYITGQRALCFQGMGRDGMAVEYFRKAAGSYHELGELAGESRQLYGLAGSQLKRKQELSAENSLNQAFKLSGKAQDRTGALRAAYKLGELFLNQKKYKLSSKQYLISLPLAEKPMNPKLLADILQNLSLCYAGLNDTERYGIFADSAKAIIHQYNLPISILDKKIDSVTTELEK